MGEMRQLGVLTNWEHFHGEAPRAFPVLAGQTLQAMVDEVCRSSGVRPEELEVYVARQHVPPSYWRLLRPKEGSDILVVRQTLNGGNSGAILRLAAMAALTYFTFGFGAGVGGYIATQYGVWAAAGTYMLGTLAVSALIPVSTSSTSSDSGTAWRQLTGTGNQLDKYGVIPFVVGRVRFEPRLAALPYTETLGEESWLYLMLDLGFGDLEVTSIRNDDTDVSNYSDFQYEITKTPTLFTNDVNEVSVSVVMDDAGQAVTRTTAANTTSISMDLVATGGLYGVGTSGSKFQIHAHFKVEYCVSGTDDWQAPPSPRLSGLTQYSTNVWSVDALRTNGFAVGMAWDVAAGQYDIRVTRVDLASASGGSSNTYVESFTWSVYRSIRAVNPSTTGTNKLVIRAKTSDDLNSTTLRINCEVAQKIPVYDRDAGTWSDPQVSLNASWVVYWLLTQCEGVGRRIDASRMVLDAWANYAEFCDLHSLDASTLVDSDTTLKELANKLLGSALGSLGEQAGKFRPIFDDGATQHRRTYTTLETTDFKVSRTRTRLPAALRVQFANPDADYADDEIVVLDDGYSLDGVDARGNASSDPEPGDTQYETLRLETVLTARQAWQLGRYHFAQAKFRPRTYTIELDVSGTPTPRGALIRVAHDVIKNCAGVGRVVGLRTENVPGGYAAGLVLDETIDTTAGTAYKLDIRNATDSAVQTLTCTPHSTWTNTFYLAEMPDDVEEGDAVVVYEAAEELTKLLVTNVAFGSNYTTTLTAVDYDDRVAPYWADPPDDIVSTVAGYSYRPAAPVIALATSALESDQTDDAGILTPTVHLSLSASATTQQAA